MFFESGFFDQFCRKTAYDFGFRKLFQPFDHSRETDQPLLYRVTKAFDHFDVPESLPQRQASFITKILHPADSRFADFPGRDVYDSEKRYRVVRIEEDIQISDYVLHFAAGVKFHPAVDPVGDRSPEAGCLKQAGLGIGAVQNRLLDQRHAVFLPFKHPSHRFLGLAPLIQNFRQRDQLPVFPVSPHLFLWPVRIGRDDCVGGIQDLLSRTIISFQLHRNGIRIFFLKLQDVPDIGAAESVDRLIRIADDAQVPLPCCQQADEKVLRMVRVLIFVDMQITPGHLVSFQNFRTFFEKPDGFEYQVVEIQRVGGFQLLLVSGIYFGHTPGSVSRGLGFHFMRTQSFAFEPAEVGHGRPGLQLLRRDLHISQNMLHDLFLIVGIVNHVVPVSTDIFDIAAEYPGANGMESPACRQMLAFGALDVGDFEQGPNAFFHLRGSFVRKSNRQYLPGWYALFDHVSDAMGQRACLSAAGSSEYQRWAFYLQHRFSLRFVKRAEYRIIIRHWRLILALNMRTRNKKSRQVKFLITMWPARPGRGGMGVAPMRKRVYRRFYLSDPFLIAEVTFLPIASIILSTSASG